MTLFATIVLVILVVIVILLAFAVGFFAGVDEGRKQMKAVALSTLKEVLETLPGIAIIGSRESDPDKEPDSDPDPVNVEKNENKD